MKYIKLAAFIAVVIVFGIIGCNNGTHHNHGMSVPPATTPPHVHQWSNWTVTAYATCTAQGAEARTCTLDASHKETRATAADSEAHDYNWTEIFIGVETGTCTHNSSHTAKRANIPMVSVAGGTFEMGRDLGSARTGDIAPVHNVTLSSFSIGKYQVTQAQYEAVMGNNPSNFSSSPASGEVQENRLVERVSWYDALVFCNKLSMAQGLSPAYSINGKTDPAEWGAVPTSGNAAWSAAIMVAGSSGYRLPTEAQWEYAAKGGDPLASGWVGYTYSGSDTVGDVAWYTDNSIDNGTKKTHEVGKKTANFLGLYDMSGNVWEWCWDWYDNYTAGAQTDPTGGSGADRVVRGGYYNHTAGYMRCVYRANDDPSYRYSIFGFRLARP